VLIEVLGSFLGSGTFKNGINLGLEVEKKIQVTNVSPMEKQDAGARWTSQPKNLENHCIWDKFF